MVIVHGKREEEVTGAEKAELVEGGNRHAATPSPESVRAVKIAAIKKMARKLGLHVIILADERALEQLMTTIGIGALYNTGLVDKAVDEYFKNHPI